MGDDIAQAPPTYNVQLLPPLLCITSRSGFQLGRPRRGCPFTLSVSDYPLTSLKRANRLFDRDLLILDFNLGLTQKLSSPSDDFKLPELSGKSPDSHKILHTNLVDRVSAEEAELSKNEMSQSVPALLDKIVQYKPRVPRLARKVYGLK
ncbi:hypothetical protein Clacol_004451 [Clathrus columnatus]|uniref:Uncharacterized protein n=1 Tax=Clathrus columnatus TaxID=1419009 RepID=A0AAV5AE62_9AGAM|nr:hypothetical protein Clacol_004451 [Clathrus columnatus]